MCMSKEQPQSHTEYTKWILANFAKDTTVYGLGFLAGYLASLMLEDPYVYKRFKHHIERVRNEPNE